MNLVSVLLGVIGAVIVAALGIPAAVAWSAIAWAADAVYQALGGEL